MAESGRDAFDGDAGKVTGVVDFIACVRSIVEIDPYELAEVVVLEFPGFGVAGGLFSAASTWFFTIVVMTAAPVSDIPAPNEFEDHLDE